MAIDDIFKALDKEADDESAIALAAAQEQAKGIVEDAEAQAAKIRDARVDAARARAALRSSRVLNAARLDGRRLLSGVRERTLSEAFDEALQRMDSLRGSPGYAAMFRALAAEAMEGLSGEVTISVDPADKALAAEALKASGLSGSIDASLKTRGGIRVSADGDTVLRRNTVEDRLEKFRRTSQSDIARMIA